MGVEGAAWLDRPERESEENPDLAMRLLRVSKGSAVADIGAGSGDFTVRLARAVGDKGTVYASDLQAGMPEQLAESAPHARVENHVPVIPPPDDPHLPAVWSEPALRL